MRRLALFAAAFLALFAVTSPASAARPTGPTKPVGGASVTVLTAAPTFGGSVDLALTGGISVSLDCWQVKNGIKVNVLDGQADNVTTSASFLLYSPRWESYGGPANCLVTLWSIKKGTGQWQQVAWAPFTAAA